MKNFRIIKLLNDKDSQIYLTYDEKDKNKCKYILNLIDLENLPNLTEFLKDLSWYKQLNHYNLMSLKDSFLIDTKLYLIKPYASFGSCADLLNVNPFGINEQLISHIIWQVLQGLCYLQERHIMHRGIASKNIFICDNGRVLLDNFSHCISMISSFDGKLKRQIYDYTDKLQDQILYLAPEVIYQNKDGYNYKSDVYSLGTVACELANGSNSYVDMINGYLSMLFVKIQGSQPILLDQTRLTEDMIRSCDKKNFDYIQEIKQRKYSKEFHAFIQSCVSIRLESRCSADELQTHSFFKYQKKFNYNQQMINNEIVRLLQIHKKKESIHPEIDNIVDIFHDQINDSNKKQNISWEF